MLTRITVADEVDGLIDATIESLAQDQEWNHEVELELIPHPRATYSRAIELDYGLESGQSIKLSVRAVMAGYLLRRWGVDCSSKATLHPDEYQLALRDPEWVANQVDLSISPGFNDENGH